MSDAPAITLSSHGVASPSSPANLPALTPWDIERIERCFIRLISAPLTTPRRSTRKTRPVIFR